MQHVDAFEQLKQADLQYLFENLDQETTIDINDSHQVLDAVLNQFSGSQQGLANILQHLLVGSTLLDATSRQVSKLNMKYDIILTSFSSRSHMMYIVENVVMQIVLDQNGSTEFTDAFKCSVNQIISSLGEIDRLDEENARLASLCELQEKEIINLRKNGDAFSSGKHHGIVVQLINNAYLTHFNDSV